MHPDKRRAGRRIRKQQRMRRRLRDLSRSIPVSFAAISLAAEVSGTALRRAAEQQDEFARRVAILGEPWHHDYTKEEK